eukprot:8655156-Alexandrium_andersonii.AAC.1
MSASLVGSEMCIRDSASATGTALRRCSTLPSARGAFRRPSLGRASTPVSYTHLTLPTICSV